jgi:hypothetical protein
MTAVAAPKHEPEPWCHLMAKVLTNWQEEGVESPLCFQLYGADKLPLAQFLSRFSPLFLYDQTGVMAARGLAYLYQLRETVNQLPVGKNTAHLVAITAMRVSAEIHAEQELAPRSYWAQLAGISSEQFRDCRQQLIERMHRHLWLLLHTPMQIPGDKGIFYLNTLAQIYESELSAESSEEDPDSIEEPALPDAPGCMSLLSQHGAVAGLSVQYALAYAERFKEPDDQSLDLGCVAVALLRLADRLWGDGEASNRNWAHTASLSHSQLNACSRLMAQRFDALFFEDQEISVREVSLKKLQSYPLPEPRPLAKALVMALERRVDRTVTAAKDPFGTDSYPLVPIVHLVERIFSSGLFATQQDGPTDYLCSAIALSYIDDVLESGQIVCSEFAAYPLLVTALRLAELTEVDGPYEAADWREQAYTQMSITKGAEHVFQTHRNRCVALIKALDYRVVRFPDQVAPYLHLLNAPEELFQREPDQQAPPCRDAFLGEAPMRGRSGPDRSKAARMRPAPLEQKYMSLTGSLEFKRSAGYQHGLSSKWKRLPAKAGAGAAGSGSTGSGAGVSPHGASTLQRTSFQSPKQPGRHRYSSASHSPSGAGSG